MESHPEVDLRGHQGYNPKVVETADDDLMKVVLTLHVFPFLEDLCSSSHLGTFDEILASTIDEDLDYHRLLE